MGVSTVLKDYGTDILDAIRGNDLHRLQLVLEKQLNSDPKIARVCVTDIKHRPSKKFACPLILAARQEDPSILQWMMNKGVDPNFVHHTIYSSKRREIVTALHIAVDLGFYDTVEVLLGANADCNMSDHKEETPLLIAVKKADRVMCQMLLSKGADATITDSTGNAALHIATLYGHLQLVKILLKYDADIFQKGADGAIPPHIAAKEGHIHLMHLFCSRHLGNVNIKIPCYGDQREKAPLHIAAENGHKEISHVLIDQYEADVNVRDSDGNTALHCCVLNPFDPHRMREKEDFYETAKVLLRGRVGVNAKNAFGDTALHLAAMNRFQRIVELLLEVGANPFVENDEKLKPIDVVPADDPVTKQVLKTAMLQGPRPVNLSVETLNRDISGSFMNWTKPGMNNKNARSTGTMDRSSERSGSITDSNSQDRSSEHGDPAALDRSLSIGSSQRDSRVSLPSVFGGEGGHGQESRHRAPTLERAPASAGATGGSAAHQKPPVPDKQDKKGKNQNLEKTRAVDGAVRGEGQGQRQGQGGEGRQKGRQGERPHRGEQKTDKPSEYTEMGNVPMRKKAGRDKHDKHSRDDTTFSEDQDTYSFMSGSLSTLRDGSTQTLNESSASRNRGTQASRHKKRSVSKQAQTSFADETLESVTTMEDTMSRASSTSMYTETSEFTEYSQEPSARKKSQSQKGSSRDKKRPGQGEDYEDDKVIYENFTGDLDESMQSFQSTSEYGRPVRKHPKQFRIERSKQKYRKSRHSSDMSEDMEMSQVAHYAPRAASAINPNDPVPGSVKVNSVPGRPGTIELQYSGGPITIALDTQAFSQMPADDQGEFFYDGAGNKYPVSLITALQKASLLNKTPIVTSQKGTQSTELEDTPSKVDKATGLDTETIYVNQDDISAMLDSTLATTVQDTSADMTQGFNSTQPEQVASAITQSIHEMTKTPTGKGPARPPRNALSPVSQSSANEDRATPTRRKKDQKDHLSKILGKAKGVRRGGTPTMGGQQAEEVKSEEVIEDQPTLSTQDEDSDQSEESPSEDDNEDEDVMPAYAPPLPATSPPKRPGLDTKRTPPQKKERKKTKKKKVPTATLR